MEEKKKSRFLPVFLTIMLICIIGAGVCHLYLYTSIFISNIEIECIDKVNGTNLMGASTCKLSFNVTNHSNSAVNKIVGDVKIVRKSDNKLLLEKSVSISSFSNRKLDVNENEQFEMHLYDSSENNHGVDSFNDIYVEGYSNLKVSFKVASLSLYEASSLYKTVKALSYIFQVPIYLLLFLIFGCIILIVIKLLGGGHTKDDDKKKGQTLNDAINNVGKK